MKSTSLTRRICTRRVPKLDSGTWCTDIPRTLLWDEQLKFCRFVLGDGPTVLVPVEELRRVVGQADNPEIKVCGPFTIDPAAYTINGQQIPMQM